jgi:hypothetical protein
MKNKTYAELMAQYLATEGSLKHLRFDEKNARRRHTYEIDFQRLDNPFVIHVGEVKAHAQRISDHLGLNILLTQSGSDGHDTGHVPFGHQGEDWIRKITGKDFTHEKMGIIVAQKIERKGKGLNLTFETLEAMLRHSGNNAIASMTQEAWVIRYADKIAYLFADYNDFARLGWKCSKKLNALMKWFGYNQRERTFRTIVELCTESAEAGKVQFETSKAAHKFAELRKEMYEVYSRITRQDVSSLLEPVYELLDRTKHIPADLGIALLTDNEVLRMVEKKGLLDISDIMRGTGLGEIINLTPREHLFSIDITDVDLDW